MSYTLNGNDLGQVREEPSDKSSGLEIITYPLSDSKEASVFDYQGVKRIINLSGTNSFNTAAELWNWVSDIDALQNGEQETVVYHSDGWANSTAEVGKTRNYTTGNFNVKVARFLVRHVNTVVLSVTYTLVLYEGEVGV